ncbi:hypothetical protein [Pedobacter gandavensis]|uniref:hypothetical protein n=1 Tax=Pedobacter gandavensis TaxID=2679963 RepID=UPI00292EA44D|nr:hypothetical protein [Pedobacter gandavensis]
MNATGYLYEFQQAAKLIDQKSLKANELDLAVGVFLDCICLKLYKKSWANPSADPLTSESRIFFSIWIDPSKGKEQKLFYNIHSLKLNHLRGYSIKSREFADSFRLRFKNEEYKWKNVSLKFGPLTLMQGCLPIDPGNFQEEIISLSHQFIGIAHLIDQTLASFIKVKKDRA